MKHAHTPRRRILEASLRRARLEVESEVSIRAGRNIPDGLGVGLAGGGLKLSGWRIGCSSVGEGKGVTVLLVFEGSFSEFLEMDVPSGGSAAVVAVPWPLKLRRFETVTTLVRSELAVDVVGVEAAGELSETEGARPPLALLRRR